MGTYTTMNVEAVSSSETLVSVQYLVCTVPCLSLGLYLTNGLKVTNFSVT